MSGTPLLRIRRQDYVDKNNNDRNRDGEDDKGGNHAMFLLGSTGTTKFYLPKEGKQNLWMIFIGRATILSAITIHMDIN